MLRLAHLHDVIYRYSEPDTRVMLMTESERRQNEHAEPGKDVIVKLILVCASESKFVRLQELHSFGCRQTTRLHHYSNVLPFIVRTLGWQSTEFLPQAGTPGA